MHKNNEPSYSLRELAHQQPALKAVQLVYHMETPYQVTVSNGQVIEVHPAATWLNDLAV